MQERLRQSEYIASLLPDKNVKHHELMTATQALRVEITQTQNAIKEQRRTVDELKVVHHRHRSPWLLLACVVVDKLLVLAPVRARVQGQRGRKAELEKAQKKLRAQEKKLRELQENGARNPHMRR